MIKVNLRNGETLSYDLKDVKESAEWRRVSSQLSFQKKISGVGIIFNSQWYTLPIPKKFRQITFHAELVKNTKKDVPKDREFVGEKIIVYADEIMISILVYYGKRPKMSRVDVVKIGKCRYNPALREVQ